MTLYENTVILKNIVAVFIPPAILILGFYYFNSRKKFDTDNLRIERKRIICEAILNQINIYDKDVSFILEAGVKSQKELDVKRDKISRDYELIYAYLESCGNFFSQPSCDYTDIIKLNSFVNNDTVITTSSFENLTKNIKDRYERKLLYIDFLQAARVACLRIAITR